MLPRNIGGLVWTSGIQLTQVHSVIVILLTVNFMLIINSYNCPKATVLEVSLGHFNECKDI